MEAYSHVLWGLDRDAFTKEVLCIGLAQARSSHQMAKEQSLWGLASARLLWIFGPWDQELFESAEALSENVMRDMETLDAHFKHMVKFRFAPQRFDTVLEVACIICLHVKPLVRTLVQLQINSDDPRMSTWSKKMLGFFQGPHLIRLALIAELAASAAKYHHCFDMTKKGNASIPWPRPGEKLVFYRPGAHTEMNLRKQVAVELGSIQNVAKLYLPALAGEHQADYATALGPFDTEFWQVEFSDDRLPEP
eukprot:s2531_g3.t1